MHHQKRVFYQQPQQKDQAKPYKALKWMSLGLAGLVFGLSLQNFYLTASAQSTSGKLPILLQPSEELPKHASATPSADDSSTLRTQVSKKIVNQKTKNCGIWLDPQKGFFEHCDTSDQLVETPFQKPAEQLDPDNRPEIVQFNPHEPPPVEQAQASAQSTPSMMDTLDEHLQKISEALMTIAPLDELTRLIQRLETDIADNFKQYGSDSMVADSILSPMSSTPIADATPQRGANAPLVQTLAVGDLSPQSTHKKNITTQDARTILNASDMAMLSTEKEIENLGKPKKHHRKGILGKAFSKLTLHHHFGGFRSKHPVIAEAPPVSQSDHPPIAMTAIETSSNTAPVSQPEVWPNNPMSHVAKGVVFVLRKALGVKE